MNDLEVQQLESSLSNFDDISQIVLHGKKGEIPIEVAISDKGILRRVVCNIRFSLEMMQEPVQFKRENVESELPF